jgi:pimeloyl-ACP methyl ester carboxylesterase
MLLRNLFGRNSRLALFGLLGAVSMGLAGLHAASAQQPNEQPSHALKTHIQPQHAEQPHGPRAHVYLLRGLFNVFSLGMDTLGQELSKRGVETSVDNYADWQSLADRAAARYKAGTENPIILIGHSLGADAVMDMAAYLGRRDVPVALVIPFDGTKTLVAPSNVGRVVNLTQRSYAYARPGMGFHGSLANVDVSFDKNIDHINIDKAARTHARAISEVLAVVGHPSAAPKDQQAPAPEKTAPAEDANTQAAPADKQAPAKSPSIQN